jgi:hypothetical protein
VDKEEEEKDERAIQGNSSDRQRLRCGNSAIGSSNGTSLECAVATMLQEEKNDRVELKIEMRL